MICLTKHNYKMYSAKHLGGQRHRPNGVTCIIATAEKTSRMQAK
jgi:hypothetical protein